MALADAEGRTGVEAIRVEFGIPVKYVGEHVWGAAVHLEFRRETLAGGGRLGSSTQRAPPSGAWCG